MSGSSGADDARLVAWLEATQRALEATEIDRMSALDHACEARSRLMQSLVEHPAAAPSAALGRALAAAEARLQQLLQQLRSDVERHVAELRRVRSAARGYLPTASNGPSLISRDA